MLGSYKQSRKVLIFNNMKRIIPICFIVFIVILSGCGSSTSGELTGVQGRKKYFEPDPYGMKWIPMGAFNVGPSDQDVAWAQNNMSKTVSIEPFWMDETEITNNEYRQFVHWVRDSIFRRTLANAGIDGFLKEDKDGLYDMLEESKRPLNWRTRIDERRNDDQREALEELYYAEHERFYGRKDVDTRKLVFEYYWVDMQQAAHPRNRFNFQTQQYNEGAFVINTLGERVEVRDRSAFIMHDRVHVYPDTLVWISDFSYSYNEPMTAMYFHHVAYDSYPVVGVNWKQAMAFCRWRTNLLNDALESARNPIVHHYRLPIEYEWEWAARGGLANNKYPWGGPYTRNNQGCFLANFKPLRGNYADDGGVRTVRVGTYEPNDYGLYDMAGNVAEWTISAYDESGDRFTHDLNPNYQYNALPNDPPVMKRKVIRGGSWKDVEYYLRVSTRAYEYQDTASTYIGFRCVRDYLGNSVK